MSAALFGRGTVLSIGTGSGTITYNAIQQLTMSDGPKIAAAFVETTNHATAALGKESIATQVVVTYSFDLNFIPTDTQHQLVRTNALGGITTPFKVVNVGETTGTTFTANIKNWSESKPVDKQLTAKFDIEITGAFTAPT